MDGYWCAKSAKDEAIPISYTIDAENGFALSFGEGTVTARELFEYLAEQVRDPDVPLPLRDLHDLSQVERFEVGGDDMRKVVTGLQHDPQRIRDARLAIVAPKDHVFGMYRMFELQSEHTPPVEQLRQQGQVPQVKVFRDRDEARAWLLASSLATSPDEASP